MVQSTPNYNLGGTPMRPRTGVPLSNSGSQLVRATTRPRAFAAPLGAVNSRVQHTGLLLATQAPGSGLQLERPVTNRGGHGSGFRPGPIAQAALTGAATAAMGQGLAALGAPWLIQGLALAAGGQMVSKALEDSNITELEKEVRIKKAAQALHDPFENKGVVGRDRIIYLEHSPHSRPSPREGLGSTTGTAATAASTVTAISAAAIKSGSSVATSSTWLAAAGGPIGVAVAGATVALTYLFSRQRPARKVATTEIVDSVEPLLQNNLTGYLSGPRTATSQAQALANFDAGWDFVVNNCGIPDMGEPGKWCINDRKRGGKWDWFARYRDPIANDAHVIPDLQPNYRTFIDPATNERVVEEDPYYAIRQQQATMGGGFGAGAGEDSSSLILLLMAGVVAFAVSQG